MRPAASVREPNDVCALGNGHGLDRRATRSHFLGMTAPPALRLTLIVAAVGVLVACGSHRARAVAPRCGSGEPPTSVGAQASREEAGAIPRCGPELEGCPRGARQACS